MASDYIKTGVTADSLSLSQRPNFLDDAVNLPQDQTLVPGFLLARDAEATSEPYGGYKRGELILSLAWRLRLTRGVLWNKNEVFQFNITEEQEPHKINFQGTWIVRPESSTHCRRNDSFEDYLALVYMTTSVNVVLTSNSGKPYKVRVTVGGESLTEKNKGSDIVIGEDGESYIWIMAPTLYNVIDNESYIRRENLKMVSNFPDFSLFAFTFGVYDTIP